MSESVSDFINKQKEIIKIQKEYIDKLDAKVAVLESIFRHDNNIEELGPFSLKQILEVLFQKGKVTVELNDNV